MKFKYSQMITWNTGIILDKTPVLELISDYWQKTKMKNLLKVKRYEKVQMQLYTAFEQAFEHLFHRLSELN